MKFQMSVIGLLVFICVVVTGIVDLYFVVFQGTGSSVSSFLINTGIKSPVFVFFIGACCSHLFWYMWPSDEWTMDNLRAERMRQLRTGICSCVVYEAVRRLVVHFL